MEHVGGFWTPIRSIGASVGLELDLCGPTRLTDVSGRRSPGRLRVRAGSGFGG